MTIVLHHLERSRSQRIAWLLEELAVSYEIKRYKRDRRTMLAPPELRAVHRLGKAPIVVDDGTVLIESGAIIEYLIARHGPTSGLAPAPGSPDHLAYSTFLHFAEGSMMPPLLLRLIFATMNEKAPRLMRPLVRAITTPVEKGYVGPNLAGILDFLETELSRRPWFAGASFTGADIQMSFPIEMARQRGGLDASRPELMAFLSRIHERPAYRTAKDRIGEA
jgi:glutathione S-transferase